MRVFEFFEFFEFWPAMLHAKILVVDDLVVVVGTANADSRSCNLNFEVADASYQASVCERLGKVFLRNLDFAKNMSASDVACYGHVRRFGNMYAAFSPLL